ncbi:MAG: hypothetical protein ACRDAM_00015 [Casimicrobium sp.]
MRYSFRTIAGMPSVPSVGLSVVLADKVSSQGGKAATMVPLVDLAVATTTPNVAAGIGTPANVTFNFTNPGAIAGDGATITLPWLANNANRTVGAATVTPSGGALTATPSNAALLAGLAVSAFPVGAGILVTVPVTALVAFSESMIAQIAPPEGVGDVAPTNNVAVATVVGSTPSATAKWEQWTDTTTATSITVGVAEKRFSPDIRFCGDNYTKVGTSSGDVIAPPCPPAGVMNSAKFKIKIANYVAANTYAISIDESALTPAVNPNVFSATRTGDTFDVTTGYGLLGSSVGDEIAASGNVVFTVTENGNNIGTLTMVVQAYPATF